MKYPFFLFLFLFLFFGCVGVSAIEIQEGVTIITGDNSSQFYVNGTFNVSNITVYSGTLNINGGNMTAYPNSGWLNMTLDTIGSDTFLNFTNNRTISILSIWDGFSNFSISEGRTYYLKYSNNDIIAKSDTAGSDLKVDFQAVSGGIGTGYYMKGNSAPTATAIKTEGTINPTQITDTTPDFSWTYSDVDGDAQSHWRINVGSYAGASNMWDSGQQTGATTSDVYAGSALAEGTTYHLSIKVLDGWDWSDWSAGTFKRNQKPTISNIAVSPPTPTTSQDLSVTNDTATDGDNDPISLYYKWYINDTHNVTFLNMTTIGSANTSNGQKWKCGITPNDNHENGTEQFSNEVTIGGTNAAPSIPTDLAPTGRRAGNIGSLSWSASTDPESDPITYYWYVEENTQVFSSPYFSNGSTSNTFSSDIVSTDGYTYYYRVKACDAGGCSGFSEISLFIENTKPAIPGLSSPINATWVAELTPTLISNTTTDNESDSITYQFAFDAVDGTTYVGQNTSGTEFITSQSNENTWFYWRVRAFDSYELTSYSDPRMFRIDGTGPTISNIDATPLVFDEGETITISADAADALNDVYGMSVRIKRPDSSEYNYTMSHFAGNTYRYVYSPPVYGIYNISFFYATDNISGAIGTTTAQSSTIQFQVIDVGGAPPGPGGGGGGTVIINLTERIAKPLGLIENLLQRIYFVGVHEIKPKFFHFAGADKVLEKCISSKGECVIDPKDNRSFYVVYAPETDDFFLKTTIINVTVYDKEDYTNYAQLEVTGVNFWVYIPISPFAGGSNTTNYFFKLEKDMNGKQCITGIRVWWIIFSIVGIMWFVKRKEVTAYFKEGGHKVKPKKHKWKIRK